MWIMAIDPGLNGAICLMNDRGHYIFLKPMPKTEKGEVDYEHLAWILATYNVSKVFLEKAQPMTKQGVSSMFNYGKHFGILIGLLTAFKIPFHLVPPQAWTRKMHVVPKQGSAKEKSLAAARRLFPDESFLATARSRVPHDGMVDAALIAEYGRSVLCSTSNL